MGYLIGIDGGGTGCRAIISDESGRALGTGASGAANIMTDFDGALANTVEAARGAVRDAGLPDATLAEASAFLGLAGANIGDAADRLKRLLPFSRSQIDTDGTIALQGAIGDGFGTVAIIGTGSLIVSRSGNGVRTLGGWGFVVGDLGSGARLGRWLLQEALLAYDGVKVPSKLTAHVLKQFQHDPQTIVEFANVAKPGEFGRFAPLVFEYAEQDDPIASEIVANAIGDVEEMLGAAIAGNDGPLCLLGGLGRLYKKLVADRFQAVMREPLGDAVEGAVSLAVKRFGNGNA